MSLRISLSLFALASAGTTNMGVGQRARMQRVITCWGGVHVLYMRQALHVHVHAQI